MRKRGYKKYYVEFGGNGYYVCINLSKGDYYSTAYHTIVAGPFRSYGAAYYWKTKRLKRRV